MSSSLKQVAANRANATLSTGPKTPAGKAAAAKNALSHGMCSAVLTVFCWENQADFDQLRNQYMLRFQPLD